MTEPIAEPTAEDYDNAVAELGDTTSPSGDAADTSQVDDADKLDDQPNPNREAAKYRRQLRDTETERDTLRTRLETLQRGEIERLAGRHLADPADFWRDGAQLADLLDDDGNVSPDKVTAAATAIAEAHAHWKAAGPPATTLGTRSGSGASASNLPRHNSWTNAFAPKPK